jgi:hypothetical protein
VRSSTIRRVCRPRSVDRDRPPAGEHRGATDGVDQPDLVHWQLGARPDRVVGLQRLAADAFARISFERVAFIDNHADVGILPYASGVVRFTEGVVVAFDRCVLLTANPDRLVTRGPAARSEPDRGVSLQPTRLVRAKANPRREAALHQYLALARGGNAPDIAEVAARFAPAHSEESARP